MHFGKIQKCALTNRGALGFQDAREQIWLHTHLNSAEILSSANMNFGKFKNARYQIGAHLNSIMRVTNRAAHAFEFRRNSVQRRHAFRKNSKMRVNTSGRT